MTTLMLPTVPAAGSRKLVSYQTAEDSLTTDCAPSYSLRTLTPSTAYGTVEQPEMTTLLLKGWDVSVPDYEGPSAQWGVGPLEGRIELDSIRAVESFQAADLEGARTPVGLMGYSGGSIPTMWADALHASYAPELNLVGSPPAARL